MLGMKRSVPESASLHPSHTCTALCISWLRNSGDAMHSNAVGFLKLGVESQLPYTIARSADAEVFGQVWREHNNTALITVNLAMDLLLHGRPGCRMGLQHRAKNHYYVTIRKPTKSKILAIGWPWAICLLIGDPSTYCSGYLCFNEVACKLKINEINVKRKYTMGIFWAYFLKFFGCQFLVVC